MARINQLIETLCDQIVQILYNEGLYPKNSFGKKWNWKWKDPVVHFWIISFFVTSAVD